MDHLNPALAALLSAWLWLYGWPIVWLAVWLHGRKAAFHMAISLLAPQTWSQTLELLLIPYMSLSAL